jgi:hypothetical protein
MRLGRRSLESSAFALLTACGGGTVIVDYAVTADVTMHEAGGRRDAGTVVAVSRPPGLLSPYDAVKYTGPDFDWTFGTGTLGMGGSIANHSAQRVCLRFDSARIGSNLAPETVPLRTYSWSTFQDKWELLGSTNPKDRRDFTPPTLCVDPGKETRFSFGPDLTALFPTEKMFNVRWEDNQPNLLDKGVGNWVALQLPVEVGQRMQVMDVKLTATDSKARISTY